MKQLLTIVLSIFITVNLYGYEPIPYMFNKLIPYGISPDEVNNILVSSNFTTAEILPEVGTFYVTTYYPDPDLVWYNPQTYKWYNIKFTTNDVSLLFKRDSKISYFSYKSDEEFKCITVRGEDLAENTSLVGTKSKWVYKFFFHNDELFAVTSQYQDNTAVENYKNKNKNNPHANPGFIIPRALFERVINGFQTKYGSPHNSTVITLDKYADMFYKNYRNRSSDTSLNLYYAQYSTKSINLTVSYIDDIRINPIAKRFQKFIYEKYEDIADVPVDIISVINDPNKTKKNNDNNTQTTE